MQEGQGNGIEYLPDSNARELWGKFMGTSAVVSEEVASNRVQKTPANEMPSRT